MTLTQTIAEVEGTISGGYKLKICLDSDGGSLCFRIKYHVQPPLSWKKHCHGGGIYIGGFSYHCLGSLLESLKAVENRQAFWKNCHADMPLFAWIHGSAHPIEDDEGPFPLGFFTHNHSSMVQLKQWDIRSQKWHKECLSLPTAMVRQICEAAVKNYEDFWACQAKRNYERGLTRLPKSE